jgi:hypothetical protein
MPDGLYWLTESLAAVPLVLAVWAAGLGWALGLLPRDDWSDRPLVALLSFLTGSAWTTAILFVIGTIGGARGEPTLAFGPAAGSLLLVALAGAALALSRARRTPPASTTPAQPLAVDERLIIILIVAALVLRWLTTSYWPFTAYDPTWVYGQQPRLYLSDGLIPPGIGYYPQYLQLLYTYAQLGVGAICDHAARAFLPAIHIASVLAAYSLGHRLISRRAGIALAALWALYPHVGSWAHVGDLEIALTMSFTTAAAFLLLARAAGDRARRANYAIIAGLALGVAMWTKPTGGAFIWGMALVLAIDFLRARGRPRGWWPTLEAATITGLAAIPLGTVWYLRNIALGHPPLVFPPAIWLTQARQSADYLGWLLLALGLLALILVFAGQRAGRRVQGLALAGSGLLIAGALPSMPWFAPTRVDPPASAMAASEWAAVLAGALLILGAGYIYARRYAGEQAWLRINHVAMGLALALPYAITMFYSYSYHYRLTFAIVPLLALPSAALLAHWLPAERIRHWRRPVRALYIVAIILLALPGISATLYDTRGNAGWLFDSTYPDDDAKYRTQNPTLMLVVDELNGYIAETGRLPVVVAPGEQRLPFFFPTMEIISDTLPTTWHELGSATHFLYSSQSQAAYRDAGIDPAATQLIAGLGRQDVVELRLRHRDATFHYDLYALNLDHRLDPSLTAFRPVAGIWEDEVVIGESLRIHGTNLGGNYFVQNRVFVDTQFEALDPLPQDAVIFLELVNMDDGQTKMRWAAPIAPHDYGDYATPLWERGEFVLDKRSVILDGSEGVPPGDHYRLYMGMEDRLTGQRLPMTINGQPAPGDRVMLNVPFQIP